MFTCYTFVNIVKSTVTASMRKRQYYFNTSPSLNWGIIPHARTEQSKEELWNKELIVPTGWWIIHSPLRPKRLRTISIPIFLVTSTLETATVQFCSHLKMRLSETKDELAQCFASVSILSNHDVELRSKSFTFGKTWASSVLLSLNHDFSAWVDVDSRGRGFGVVRAASDVKP